MYLKIDSAIPVKRIKQVLRGVLLHKENTGTVYCYISQSERMYCWQMADLK
ncbi:MAG: hypothetical protein IKK79_02600 [Spirochaetaceae bacterium]|nr:hypothetical protein [Spirochaetaceae bacterium]